MTFKFEDYFDLGPDKDTMISLGKSYYSPIGKKDLYLTVQGDVEPHCGDGWFSSEDQKYDAFRLWLQKNEKVHAYFYIFEKGDKKNPGFYAVLKDINNSLYLTKRGVIDSKYIWFSSRNQIQEAFNLWISSQIEMPESIKKTINKEKTEDLSLNLEEVRKEFDFVLDIMRQHRAEEDSKIFDNAQNLAKSLFDSLAQK